MDLESNDRTANGDCPTLFETIHHPGRWPGAGPGQRLEQVVGGDDGFRWKHNERLAGATEMSPI